MRLALDGVRRHLAHLPAPVVADRLELVVALTSTALADRERLLRERTRPAAGSARLLVADLVDAAVGLLGAEMSGEARAEVRRQNEVPRRNADGA
jgi:hypothetical protein